MKQINFRIVFGAALILLGLLMLLERIGLLRGAASLFWGAILLVGAAYFIHLFIRAPRQDWWAVIPGFTLAGLGAATILPGEMGAWSGLFILGFLGLSFYAIYFSDRQRWWALIPGGVLVTLGVVALLDNFHSPGDSGGVFFLGLGLTFLLVAVLASMQWAYIPGMILLLIGVLLGTAFAGALDYLWPAVLILGGLILIYQYIRRR